MLDVRGVQTPPNYISQTPPIFVSSARPASGRSIHIGNPIPDKLILTGLLQNGVCEPLSPEDQEELLVAITGRVRHLMGKNVWCIKKPKYHRYLHNPLLSSFRVAVGARKRSAKFEFRREYKAGKTYRIRLEFNPRKLGAEGTVQLRAFMDAIQASGFEFGAWLPVARVSGLDVAVDCAGITPSQIIAQVPGGTLRSFTTNNSRFEIEYVNKPWKTKGPAKDKPTYTRKVRIYDRRQKLIAQGKQPGDTPVTRVETSPTMLGKHLTLAELINAPCQIADVRVGLISVMAKKLGANFIVWADIARLYGTEYASARLGLTKSEAKSFTKAWKKIEARLYDPEEIWQSWSAECKALGLDWFGDGHAHPPTP